MSEVETQIEQAGPSLQELYGEVVEGLLLRISRYSKTADVESVRRAFELSFEAHKGQYRKSGEPYFEHPLEVAKILVGLQLDYQTIIGGILHDTVEDTSLSLDTIRKEFGDQVALLVDGVTKISHMKMADYRQRAASAGGPQRGVPPEFMRQQAENFRKMLLSMVRDVRVILIKFADRLHNMRTLGSLPEPKRRRIALETQQIYAPLANRLGLSRIKAELEDLAFMHLEPETYHKLVQQVAETKAEREKEILEVTKTIRKVLVQNQITARFEGRAKHFASIHHKMTVRGVPFDEIADLQAIRIIVNEVEDCYHVLGIVHSLYKPINEKIKDYIATPKANGYRSLHTTIISERGKKVEVQIRTEEMHRVAEEGIAAHWRYKEGKLREAELDQQLNWLRQILESEEEDHDSESFYDNFKINLFSDEIFVYTPKGDLYTLPVNATPVDFAFAVHTDIGLHCYAAQVNNRIQPLSCKLKSGDVVSILTSPNKFPNKDWLRFVVTSKARSKIKKYLRDAEFESGIAVGQELLMKAARRFGLKYKDINLAELAEKFKYNSEKQLLAALGRGDIKLETVLRRLLPENRPLESKSPLLEMIDRARRPLAAVSVVGADNVLINFGRCCNPVPGEPITGIVTRGRGIVVHANTCRNLQQLIQKPERIVDVTWNVINSANRFVAALSIIGERRKNTLSEISEAVNALDSTIVGMKLGTDTSLFTCRLHVEVYDVSHLTKLKARLKKIDGIISVERLNSVSS